MLKIRLLAKLSKKFKLIKLNNKNIKIGNSNIKFNLTNKKLFKSQKSKNIKVLLNTKNLK